MHRSPLITSNCSPASFSYGHQGSNATRASCWKNRRPSHSRRSATQHRRKPSQRRRLPQRGRSLHCSVAGNGAQLPCSLAGNGAQLHCSIAVLNLSRRRQQHPLHCNIAGSKGRFMAVPSSSNCRASAVASASLQRHRQQRLLHGSVAILALSRRRQRRPCFIAVSLAAAHA